MSGTVKVTIDDPTTYRNTALLATVLLIATGTTGAAGRRRIFGLSLMNPNTVPVFVKLFNAAAAASVILGTTAPQHVICIPPGDGTTPGMVRISQDAVPVYQFDLGICIAAVTGLADASTTAPGTAINAEVQYK